MATGDKSLENDVLYNNNSNVIAHNPAFLATESTSLP